ncbi:hypothetical protein FHU42_001825 [Corynebacterium glutamicum]|nr:hypothetical protein [Corynebacterium glutamicum]
MPSTPRRAAIAVAAVLTAVTLVACSSGDGARNAVAVGGHLPVPLTRRPNRDYLRRGGTCPAAGLLRPVADGGG